MVQRTRAKPADDDDDDDDGYRKLIEQQFSDFEKCERELSAQERRERAMQLGKPELVMH